MQLLTAEEGFTRLVDYGELHYVTQHGWILLAVIQQEEVTVVEEPIPAPEGQFERKKARGLYDSSDPVLTWKKPLVTTTTRFLVRLPKDSSLAELARDWDEAKRRAGEHCRLQQQAEAALKDSEEKLAEANKSHLEVAKERERAQRSLMVSEERCRKLELDIAKIRIAVGDLRMKEILEGKAS